jgi:hypothetical protein
MEFKQSTPTAGKWRRRGAQVKRRIRRKTSRRRRKRRKRRKRRRTRRSCFPSTSFCVLWVHQGDH